MGRSIYITGDELTRFENIVINNSFETDAEFYRKLEETIMLAAKAAERQGGKRNSPKHQLPMKKHPYTVEQPERNKGKETTKPAADKITNRKTKVPPIPKHEDFYTYTAIILWEAALAHHASVMGALLLITQAANESGYSSLTHGIAAKYKDYNLFGKTTANKSEASSRPTSYKKLWFKKYSSYQEAINDHFKGFRNSGHWPEFAEILAKDTITSTSIDSTLNTGTYIPTKQQRNKGILPYNTDINKGGFKDNANHYGEILRNQDYPGVKKDFIAALKYQIDINSKEVIQLSNYLKMMIFTSQSIDGFKQRIAQLALDNEKYQKILNVIGQ